MEKAQKIKTKVRFTSLDVAAIVSNFQSLIGMRATNIYDLNPTTYMIKLAKSQQKHYLLIENGVRFHTTSEKPDKKTIPSGFTMKFRKFLRSKRLESVRQVGVERVVVFSFGSQTFANHLILELYSQGNIILTDNNYRILQCIRSHQFNQNVKTAVGEIYPFQYAANIYLQNIDVGEAKIDSILEKEEQAQQLQAADETTNDPKKKKSKKANKKTALKLKDVVFKLIPCLFPLVIQHILLDHKKNPEQKVSRQNKNEIIDGAKICFRFLKDYLQSQHAGYLFQKQSKQPKQGEQKVRQYFQFSSYKNVKYLQHPCQEFGTFNEAVGQYFLNYKKSSHQQQQQFQGVAWKKYDQIKRDQDQRVKKLQQQQDIYKLKAQYIQKNISDVDAIIKIIKTMQDNSYSWNDIQRMIADSKKNGDPLANMIHQLNILKRQVTVLLGDPISQQQIFQLLPVEINIDYNAYTNATLYYQSKKRNFQKQVRTKEASQQVLKIAEKDALKKIQKKKNQVFAKNLPQRKVFWFQKFNWFISSQGYLIISGRDSHQNELVVKRYMKPGDLYMHSDYGGAASTVIKRHRKDIPVPAATLEQAASFTVCRSKAWDTKILSGAWWVYHDQVSKSAPTGEFLPTGSFMIRGKRNFIQPNRMEMGITLLFKVDNESAQRHMNDRRIHEDEAKKEEMQTKRPVFQVEETKDQQQFAIVSIDTQTKKQKQQEMKERKKQNLLKKQNPQSVNLKEQKLKIEKQQKQSENQNSDNDSQDSNEGKTDAPKQLSKKVSQVNKNQKGGNKKQEPIQEPIQEPQQKHKQRNKKKLKKLQKYLQQQDQDEREIIMKMLGAKQMKHMKEPQSEQQPEQKNKKNKKDKKAKKGLSKYFDIESDQQQMKEKLNPNKVLFLKKKNQAQEKQLMQNSESSDDQKLKEQQKQTQQQKQKQQQTQQQQGKQVQQQEPQQKDEEDDQQDNVQQEAKQQTKPEEQEQIDEKILDSQLGELYKLVGKPHPEDKFDCLVAMCAPYNSIKDYKFKVKLVPGALKKGKAARNVLQFFLTSELTEKEKPMIKAIPQQELINAIIGNVKLAGAGLLKIQMKEKQAKKLQRKQEDKKKEQKQKE